MGLGREGGGEETHLFQETREYHGRETREYCGRERREYCGRERREYCGRETREYCGTGRGEKTKASRKVYTISKHAGTHKLLALKFPGKISIKQSSLSPVYARQSRKKKVHFTGPTNKEMRLRGKRLSFVCLCRKCRGMMR